MSESVNILEQLSAYLDGELDASDARVVEAAAAADADVARELERLRAAKDLVRRLPREQAPEDFALRVMAQAERRTLLVHEEPALPHAGRRWLRASAMAAAVLLVLSGGLAVSVILYQGLRSEPSRRVATHHAAPQPDVVVRYGHSYDTPPSPAIQNDVAAKFDQPTLDDRSADNALLRAELGTAGGKGTREGNRDLTEWPEEFQDLARTFPLKEWDRPPATRKPNAATSVESAIVRRPESDAALSVRFHYDTVAEAETADTGDALADTEHVAANVENQNNAADDLADTGGFQEKFGDDLAMLISTDDVAQTRRQVEKIFADNGIAQPSVLLLDVPSLPPMLSQAAVNHLAYENTMVQRFRTGDRPVDVVILQADVTPEQADTVAKALAELRRGQPTPQRPVEEAHERNKLYLTVNTRRNMQLTERTQNRQDQSMAAPSDNESAIPAPRARETTASREATVAKNKAAAPAASAAAEPTLRPAPARTPIAQAATQAVQAADPKIQPAEPRLQRMIVTVEYRQLPKTTTRPATEPAPQNAE